MYGFVYHIMIRFFVLKPLIPLVGIPCRYPWALFPLLTSFVLLTFNPASSCSITMILCASQDFANGGNFKASIKINFWRTLNAKLKKKSHSISYSLRGVQITLNSRYVFEWVSALRLVLHNNYDIISNCEAPSLWQYDLARKFTLIPNYHHFSVLSLVSKTFDCWNGTWWKRYILFIYSAQAVIFIVTMVYL